KILSGYEFRLPPDDLFDRFEDIIGVSYYEGSEVYKITFWVSDKSAPYIETKPLHGSQKKIKGEKASMIREKYNISSDGTLFSIECMNNYELIRELCSFGGDLKVLSPEPIVKAIKQRITAMSNTYGL
ncbi:MAG: WYL domain-containing protein, partial [Bacteroidales bacterium]|nr:WYL domain-containing protein [Bacteroidales bacterium]